MAITIITLSGTGLPLAETLPNKSNKSHGEIKNRGFFIFSKIGIIF